MSHTKFRNYGCSNAENKSQLSAHLQIERLSQPLSSEISEKKGAERFQRPEDRKEVFEILISVNGKASAIMTLK